MPTATQKILIRSTNWLGDALLTTPAIHSIKNQFPEAELTVLARPGVAPVFETNPDIRRVMVYENQGRHRGLRGKWLLAQALKRESFEAVVHFPHSFEAAWISFLSGIPVRVGYATEGRGPLLTRSRPLPRNFKERHQVLSFLELLAGLGIRETPGPESHPLRLMVAAHWQAKADRRLAALGVNSGDSLIGLAPGAQYGRAKCWPFSAYHQLAERFRNEAGARVILLGTARDALAGLPEGTDIPAGPFINLIGRTDLGEALALVQRCRAVVSNDSGLMHVAAALNRPLVALFGSTSPERTGPWGGTSRVIRKAFPCSPCFRKECREDRFCMEAITVEEVWEAVSALLRETRA
jgi:heptosyltransferase II